MFGIAQNIHHNKRRVAKLGVFLLIAAGLMAALVFVTHKLWPSEAKFTQTDNNGSFVIDFTDSAGISEKSDNIVIQDGALMLTDNQPGYFITSEIRPASSGGWTGATISGSWSARADVRALYLDCAGNLLPGISGNAEPGIAVSNTGTFSLLPIPSDMTCVKMKFNLSDSTASGLNPSVSRIGVNWIPQTVYGLRLSGTPTTAAGNNLIFNLDYSFSYAAAEGVVIHMPLPTAVAGSYTAAYGQDLSLTFNSATSDGAYTATEITVNGVTVPANSVYWDLGAVQAGDAGSVSAQFMTRNGTENGVQYSTTAKVESSLDEGKTAGPAVSAITSSTSARISKTSSGTIYMPSQQRYYVYDGRPEVTYTISAYEYLGNNAGRETMFNPVIVDDLTNIINALTTCGVSSANMSNYIKNISNSGVLDASAKTITWNSLANIIPGNTQRVSFVVDYTPCKGVDAVYGTNINNIASFTADNQTKISDNRIVNLFGIETTRGAFAKGEKGSINSGTDDPRISVSSRNIPYGSTTTYQLYTVNEGLNRLDDIVMRDKIPEGMEFVSATIPSSAAATIYYYTATDHTDPKSPPAFDYNNPTASGWTMSLPSSPADVQWVAFYVPCLSSVLMPAGGSCQGKPQSATGTITVRVKDDAYNLNANVEDQNVCAVTNFENWGDFGIYSSSTDPEQQEDSDVTHGSTAIATLQDKEPSVAYTQQADLSTGSSVTGPSTVGAGEMATYVVTVSNNSNVDTSDQTTVTIPIPTVAYGDQTRSLTFTGLSGAGNWEQVGNDIVIRPGVIPRGSSREYTITFVTPRGVLENARYTVSAIMAATDVNNCGTSTVTRNYTTSITGQPKLSSYKSVDQNLIGNFAVPGNNSISYHINLRSMIGNNSNPLATKNTFAVDQIPDRTTFSAAYTTATSVVSSNQAHNCTGCKVYFASRNNSNLPSSILMGEMITPNDVLSQFVLGTEVSPGVWQPIGMAAEDVLYVAYLVDDPTVGLFELNSNVWVGLDVVADPTLAVGSIITNAPVMISNQTLQAIANTVRTIVLDDPGLNVEKTSSSETVLPNSEFDWLVDYTNSSSADDTVVTITDTLPFGVELVGVYHQYNQTAITAGKPSGEQTWVNNVQTSVNSDGSTNVIIYIANSNGENNAPFDVLPPQQGGQIRLRVKTSDTLTAGDILLNQANGCYQNATVGPYCVQDDNVVEIQTPDLDLTKSISNPSPRLGSETSYTLILRNIGTLPADGVTITDTLPAGLCYVVNSTTTVPVEYNSEPAVAVAGVGNDCANNPTTLAWTIGAVPADSTDIIIRYRVTVESSVGQGNTVENHAVAATTTFETNLTNNSDSASLTTPKPDAYVKKRASDNVIQPGDTYNYFIEYGNMANERATGVYLVDQLPDVDGDGKTDITIESIVVPNNETVYYYDANVSGPLSAKNISATYDFANDADFSIDITDFDATNPTNPSYPTHIIVVNTGRVLGGGVLDYYENAGELIITSKAVNPYTGHLADINTEYLNAAYLDQTSLDNDDTNNETVAIVTTPSADLAITKTGSVEGALPGVAAGDAMTYEVSFSNNSTVAVCGVHITDTIPNELQSFSHNLYTLELTDRSTGQYVFSQDQSGQTKNDAISITYDGSVAGQAKWYIGSTNPVSPDYYMNVCLPPNSTASFEITALTSSATLDQTELTNIIRIDQDGDPGAEKYLVNNEDSSSTYIYRSNLRLVKTAVASGANGTIGNSDDSTTTTNPNETIRYRLEYDNNGHYTAADSFITDAIPAGVCFVAGSIDNLPATATVKYSSDDGSTWGYSPTGSPDCNVTNILIELGDITAPANAATSSTSMMPDPGELGYMEVEVRTDLLAGLEVKQVSTGATHTCVVAGNANDNTEDWVYCWGNGTSGKLGNNSTANSYTPVKVSQGEIPTGFIIKQISVGSISSCVIAGNNTDNTNDWSYCWGSVSAGILGNGAVIGTFDSPVTVHGGDISGKVVKQISVGSSHACAIAGIASNDTMDQAYCWGSANSGALGNGLSSGQMTTPSAVGQGLMPSLTVKQISASYTSTCAIASNDQAYCWGSNSNGQLGNGESGFPSITTYTTPIAVNQGAMPSLVVEQISVGENHACAIASDKQAYCWGTASNGKLGNGVTTSSYTSPVAVLAGAMPSLIVKQISAGYLTTCAIASDDQVYCWGGGFNGQLGDGSNTASQSTPVAVSTSGVLAGLTAMQISLPNGYSGGNNHVCMVASDNQSYCWGYNNSGQLGEGSTSNQNSPVLVGTTETQIVVDPSTGVQFQADTVSAGGYHTCAITTNGKAYCWGRNNHGQLGNGSTIDQSIPAIVSQGAIPDGYIFKQISAGQGNNFSCAIVGNTDDSRDDHAYCWGFSGNGQLGNGSITDQLIPVAVNQAAIPDGYIFKQISAGTNLACAIVGSAMDSASDWTYCWGTGASGGLGNGSTVSRYAPVAVSQGAIPSGFVIKTVSTGFNKACAVAGNAMDTVNDQAYCWGAGSNGELGDGLATSSSTPVAVNTSGVLAGLTIRQISISTHTCAIASDDQAYCWGLGTSGQLGDGLATSSSTPVAVNTSGVLAGLTVEQISTGYDYTCVVASDDKSYCWGADSYGKLGDGLATSSSTPVAVDTSGALAGLTVKQISVGQNHACVIASDSNTYCWGYGYYGQLGNGSSYNSHTPVGVDRSGSLSELTVKQISSGVYHTCAIASDDWAYCWGNNTNGQLGNGSTTNQFIPVAVSQGVIPVGETIIQISVGESYTCAIASNGQAYCWGYNYDGQLGNGLSGSANSSSTPVAVSQGAIPVGETIIQIITAAQHACAIASNNQAYCWGDNAHRQLGNGSNVDSSTPVAVIQGERPSLLVNQISASYRNTCVIASDNQAYCWGYGSAYVIGNGLPDYKSTPVAVSQGAIPVGETIIQIITAAQHACAIASNNQAYCWGMGSNGRLGNGLLSTAYGPAAVSQGDMPSLIVKQISSGPGQNSSTTCAIASDNQVYCWGLGSSGQIGNGLAVTDNSTPTAVSTSGVLASLTVKQVSTGDQYSCFIASDDNAYCWGRGENGQLGKLGIYDTSFTTPSAVWITDPVPTSSTRTTTIELPTGANIQSYDDLYITQTVGEWAFDGTVDYYFKQMVGETCSINNPDAPGINNPVLSTSAYWDSVTHVPVNSLPTTTTKWCIVADFQNAGEVVTNYTLAYTSPDKPNVNFDVKVTNPTSNQITNTATINTQTPEITKADNTDSVTLNMQTADLSVVKTVDQVYLNPTNTASGNVELTYDVVITNNGNSPAVNPKIVDTLPTGFVNYLSATQTATSDGQGGSGSANFTCSQSSGIVTCGSTGTLAVGHSATITIRATVRSDVVSGNRINNIAEVGSDTLDLNPDNNLDMADSTVIDIPNVYASKTSSRNNVNVAKEYSYTISFGNNGTAVAPNWSLTDELDPKLEFISLGITSQNGVSDLDCGYNTGTRTVECDTTSGNLAAGASASIEVFVKTITDYTMADRRDEIDNKACVSTSVAQNVADDCSTTTVTVIPGDGSAITGRVFVDYDRTVELDRSNIVGISGVEITLTGTNSAGATVSETTTTNANGEYGFYNLRPGTYVITETQPSGYTSTGSRGGYLTVDGNGSPEVSPRDGCGSVQGSCSDGSTPTVDQITKVVLLEGDASRENNFGEIQAAIGNLVWRDLNANGAVDTGEPGISGVEVSLYADTNANGNYDDGVDTWVSSVYTNAFGQYTFVDLVYGAYIVVVTDEADRLYGLVNTATPAGHETDDGYSKAGTGYGVVLSSGTPSNMTADFGYMSVDPVIQVGKTDNDTNVEIGDDIAYTITVANKANGSLPVSNVTVVDTLPTTLDYVSSSPAGVWNEASRTITWTISSLAYGSDAQFTVNTKVNNTASIEAPNNTITNPVSVTHEACSNDGSVCEDEDINTVIPHDPTLVITKDDGKTEIEAGAQTTYTITVTNTRSGSSPATNVVVTDTLPSQMTFNSTTEPGGVPAGLYSSVGHDVTWTIPSIAAGETITLTVLATVGASVPSGTVIHNYVSSTHTACSATGADCVDDDDTTVIKHQPVLTVSKTDGETEVEAGDTLTYTITIANTRHDSFDATNVVVTDTLPSNTKYLSSSASGVHSGETNGGTVTWTIPTVAYGTTITRTITVMVVDNVAKDDPVINTVNLTHAACSNTGSDCVDEDENIVILHDPTLEVSKTNNRTTVRESEEVEYTITVTNTREGSNPATNVVVTDTLPTNATFVSASTTNLTSVPAVGATGNVVWTIPSVANGSPITLTVKIKVNSTVAEDDQVINNVGLTHTIGCAPIDASCTDSDTDTVVLHDPSLIIAKDDRISNIRAGEETTYDIVVTNPVVGSSVISNVVVTDALPVGTTFVSASTTNLTSSPAVGATGNVVWTIPSVANGSPITLTVTVRVNDNVTSGTTLTNTASTDHAICADDVDSNCTDSDTNTVIKHDPVLVITKDDSKTEIEAGQSTTYTITVTNTKSDSNPATNVVVTDTLATELEFDSTTEPGGVAPGVYSSAGHDVSWTIPSVAYGEPITLTVTATVNSSTLSGTTIHNYVSSTHTACSTTGSDCTDDDDNTVIKHQPSLTVSKTDGETEVEAGDTLTYTITIANTRHDSFDATNVVVTDTLPSNVSYVTSSNGGVHSGETDGGTVSWTIPTVAYGTSITRTITVTIHDTAVEDDLVTNNVNLTHAACADTDSDCSDEDENIIIPHEPTLVVSKTNYRDVIEESDETTYTVVVTNTREGSYPATGVVVTDALPTNATFISASTTGLTSSPAVGATGNVVWTIPSVAYGTPVSMTVTIKVNSTVSEDDEVVNNVGLTHTVGCAQTGSSCTDTDTDTVVLHDPGIIVGKDDHIAELQAGTQTTYDIVLTNPVAGSYTIENIAVTDTLPTGTTFVSASDNATGELISAPAIGAHGNVVWNVPSLAFNNQVTLTVTVEVEMTVLSGTEITNNVVLDHAVCSSDPDAVCDDADTNTIIKQNPDLVISKDNSQTTVQIADSVIYQIVVANTRHDSNPAENVSVVDTLPGELEFDEASDGGVFNPLTNEVVWDGLTLEYDNPITLTVKATIKDDAAIWSMVENTAHIDHAECVNGQDILPQCTDNDIDEIIPRDAQLIVTKDDSHLIVEHGQELTYHIMLTSTVLGSLPSTNVEVVDTLPIGLNFVSASDGGVYDAGSHTVTWTVPSVNYGMATELTVTTKVAETTINGQEIGNTVNLIHDDCELDGSVCQANDSNRVFVPPLPPSTGIKFIDDFLMANPWAWLVLPLAVLIVFIVIMAYKRKRA